MHSLKPAPGEDADDGVTHPHWALRSFYGDESQKAEFLSHVSDRKHYPVRKSVDPGSRTVVAVRLLHLTPLYPLKLIGHGR